MVKSSKIGFFLLLTLTVLLTVSCEKNKNDVIPDVYVNFYMDITGDILFSDLNAIGNHVIVTSQTNNWGSQAAGYDNNGIIVYRSLPDEFNAYDRTCPHDFAVNGLSIKVNVDFTQAVCPRCSTCYALSAFGTPVSGPGQYPLKNYKTRFDEKYLSVWNE